MPPQAPHDAATRMTEEHGDHMLLEFLKAHKTAIQSRSEQKFLTLAGEQRTLKVPPTRLPIFVNEFLRVLEQAHTAKVHGEVDRDAMVQAANNSDEPAIAAAAGFPNDVDLANSAGAFGKELQHLGYTLSHVVHAYGAICQAITEVAIGQNIAITTQDFRVLNRCLDTAIAGAVTVFHAERVEDVSSRETQNLGLLAHELRNALAVVNTSLRLIRSGAVGFGGSVGQVMDRALKRQQQLIDRSLVEVRMRTDPEVRKECISFFQLIDHAIISADAEARVKSQAFDVEIEPGLKIEADQYLLFSAVSILLQNAIQHTGAGGVIRIRAHEAGNKAVIEVEDQRAGINHAPADDVSQPFECRYGNEDEAGPGLTVARRAVELNDGTIDVRNLSGNGCVFRINLPARLSVAPAA
jgi:signal transduction histidine kinase